MNEDTYTIQQGDTLGKIAPRYGTDVNTLARTNSIANPNLIRAGATLTLPSVSSGVPAESLKSTAPVAIPQTTQAVDPNALVSSFNTEVADTGKDVTAAESEVNKAQTDLQILAQQLGEETAFTQKVEEQTGIPLINQELLELQNQARQRNLEYQKQYITAEGRPVAMGVIVGEQAQRQREAAIDIALINSNIQAKQGQLALAQATVDRAVQAQFEPLKAKIEVQKLMLDQNYRTLSRADQKLADAKKTQLDLKMREIETQENERKSILNLVNTVASKGAPNSLIQNLARAKTVDEFFSMGGGKYLEDADTQVVKLDNGSTVVINSRTGDVIKRLGGADTTSVSGGGSGSGTSGTPGVSDTVVYYAKLLGEGKINLSNVPQNIRNSVVNYSKGNINTKLSDTAIEKITQTEGALENLNVLTDVIKNNLEYVGPVKGLQKYNPYSKARQAQADIDRVRQTVGKALEGGVLRKEDEEKYKKILATLNDTPETALYKIEALKSSLERDIQNYKSNQSEAGRYVKESGTSSKPEDLRKKYNY